MDSSGTGRHGTEREGPSRRGSDAMDGPTCRCGRGGIARSAVTPSWSDHAAEVDRPGLHRRTQRRDYRLVDTRNKMPDTRTISPGNNPRWITRISWITVLVCVASWPVATRGLFVSVQESVNASAGYPTTIPCTYGDNKQDDVVDTSSRVVWTRIQGSGPPEVLLTKLGSSLGGKWYEDQLATFVNEASLLIFAVSSQDAGKYTCTVDGMPGTTELFVDNTPTIHPDVRELVLTAGQALELTCTGAGKLTWSWPEHEAQHITRAQFYNPSSGWQTNELRIRQASVLDTGEYRCFSDDQWTSEPVYVYVTSGDGPLFLDNEQTDLIHYWDEPSLIPCRLATPTANVTLRSQETFDPEVVTYDPRWGFTLQARLPDYGGHVSCHAILGNRTDTQNFTVNYVVKPQLSVEGSDETILEYSELELICSGVQPIHWLVPDSRDSRLQIVHTLTHAPFQPPMYQSTLRLANVRYTDTNEYACRYDRYKEFAQEVLKSTVYVFVKCNGSYPEHLFLSPDDKIIPLKMGNENFIVPCRVNDPNTNVTISAFFTETITEFSDFFQEWDVNYDPRVGFRVTPKPGAKALHKLTVTCEAAGQKDHFNVVVEGATDAFPTMIEPSSSRLVQGMGSYSLTCTVSLSPLKYPVWTLDYKPKVEFTFPNQEQDKAENNTQKVDILTYALPSIILGSRLTLHRVSLRNSGTFKCRIYNIERTVTLNTSLLVLEEGIVELTHYSPDQDSVEAVEGQSQVCLRARVTSFPVAQYWWSKNGVNLTSATAPRFTALHESPPAGDALLVSGCIANLTSADGGPYEVVAANGYHTRNLTILLSVLEIPDVSLAISPEPLYGDPALYYTKQNYSLACRGWGQPAPLLDWQWHGCADPLCNFTALLAAGNRWQAVGDQPWAQAEARARSSPAPASPWSSESVLRVGRPPQSGVFRCVGRSPSDQIQDVAYATLEFRLTDLKFSLNAAPELKPVYAFDQASLVCKTNIYSFTEDVAWDWTPAGNASAEPIPIGRDDERVKQWITGYHYSTVLIINTTLANDTGLYRCTAQKRSTGESVIVYKVQLIVEEIVPPSFTKKLHPTYELDKNKIIPYDFVLECEATGGPLPTEIVWSKDGRRLTAQNSSSVVADLETFRAMNDTLVSRLFLATDITPAHGGVYRCFVMNNGGMASTQGEVLLQESPTAVIGEDVYTGRVGENLTIPCDTTGIPSPETVWRRLPRGASSQEDVPAEMYGNSARALVFKQLQVADNGEYTCIAQNQHGEARDTVTLIIHMENTYLVPLLAGGSIALIIFVILLILMIGMAKRNCRLARKAKRNSEGMELGLVTPRYPRSPMSPFRMSFKEEFGDQLPFDSKWEFPRDRLKLGSIIGQGAFGMVLKGVAAGINRNEKYVPVAVKTVKSDASYVDRKALFGELKMLIQVGHHLNVVNFLGACTQDSPPLVIVEICPYGNLSDYLRSKRDTFQPVKSPPAKSEQEENLENELNYADLCLREACVSEPPAAEYELVDKEAKRVAEKCLSVEDLVCFCFQVARGMEFLASRKCIHRDLAARNVLLGGNNVVKICDFGLSRSFYHDTDYIGSGKGLLPIKWMAPEAIFDKIFTTYSDIWSFGVFTWEVFSLGGSPYPGIQVDEKFYDKMKSGYRMSCPEHAPRAVYQLMLECWSDEPKDRPMFSELAEQFGEQLESNTRQEYIDLNIPYQEGQYCELDFGKLSVKRKQDTVPEEAENMQPSSGGQTAEDASADHFHDPTYHRGPNKEDTRAPDESSQSPPTPGEASTEIIGETCPQHKYAVIKGTLGARETSPGFAGSEEPLPNGLPEDPYRGGAEDQPHTYMSVKGARPGRPSAEGPQAGSVAAGPGESNVDSVPSSDDGNKPHTYASIRGSRPDPREPEKGEDRNHLYSSIRGSRPSPTLAERPEVRGKDFDLPDEELSLLGRPELPERDFQSMSLVRPLDGKSRAPKPQLPRRDFSTLSWSPESETLLSCPDSQESDTQIHPVYV